MSKRTFGLFSALAVLSIGAFTSYLVLAYPDPRQSSVDSTDASNTAQIDSARTIANASSRQQAAAAQQSTGSAKSSGSSSQIANLDSQSTQPVAAPTAAPSSSGTTSPNGSSQQPAATSPTPKPQAQEVPPVIQFIDTTVNSVLSLVNVKLS